MVEITDAEPRDSETADRLVGELLRVLDGRTFGSRQAIHLALSKQIGKERLSAGKLAGIMDAFLALRIVLLYEVHGRADLFKLSTVGEAIVAALKRGKSLSEIVADSKVWERGR